MGNWAITVTGIGPHHNQNYENDVNRLAAGFVRLLRRAGQNVTGATLTFGAAQDLQDPAWDINYGRTDLATVVAELLPEPVTQIVVEAPNTDSQ